MWERVGARRGVGKPTLATVAVVTVLAVLLMWQPSSSGDANTGTAPLTGRSRDVASEGAGLSVEQAVAEMVTLLPKASIPAIYEPTFVSASEGDGFLASDDLVIGVAIGGEAHAYGTAFLGRHEIVNDVVGGRAVAVTWCPLCFTALVYEREFPGREAPLRFGVSGKLIRNALVMYDRETDTLWSQFLGVAVEGELLGTSLEPLPSMLMEWAAWKALHPETVVLEQEERVFDRYTPYYEGVVVGVFGERHGDGRLGPKEFVLGIQLPGFQRAYAFRDLSEFPVVNDHLGATALAVVFDADLGTGVAFNREVDGRSLTFDRVLEPSDGRLMLRDRETRTLWAGMTGVAVDGELEGERLEQLTFTQMFWFAWTDYYEQGPLWKPPGSVQ